MGKQITSSHTFPFQGGIDEVHDISNLTPVALINGKFPVGMSQAQNVRPVRPGFDQRGGMAKQHATTDHSTKEIISMYGFSKGRIDEKAFFVQLDDGSVEIATTNPPGVTA